MAKSVSLQVATCHDILSDLQVNLLMYTNYITDIIDYHKLQDSWSDRGKHRGSVTAAIAAA